MISETLSAPQTAAGLGIRRSLCEDLAVKILYLEGELSLLELADRLHLSLSVVEEVYEHLRKVQLCEVRGMNGNVRRIALSLQGRARAIELLTHSQYAGAAPVSLEAYTRQVCAQSVRDVQICPEQVERALNGLVLDKTIISQLGTAIVSGRAILLCGPSGTGKTAIAECLPGIYNDAVWIPYAVEVDSRIITVYDSHIHESCVESGEGALDEMRDENHPAACGEFHSLDGDHRWILCRRPRVVVGGELTQEMLNLRLGGTSNFYSAPLQMKANNGVLIVDDFGRQRMRPEELLNRWIVPLDRRIDFLTLAGGKTFEVPFDLFLVLASNHDVGELADEAFLRRIQTKVKVGYMNDTDFREVCVRMCDQLGVAFDAAVVEEFIGLLASLGQPLRPCYPRDVMQSICWEARYQGREPVLDSESVKRACRSYFAAP
jgi:predicted ATPase with chaperone activity